VQLANAGVRKTYHADFDMQQADTLYQQLAGSLRQMAAGASSGCGCGGRCGE
jgi:hypothetical protein